MSLPHREVAEEFVRGGTYEKGSRMFIEGDVLYSYGHHFPIAIRREGKILYNIDGYSVSTSSHQGYLARALGYENKKDLIKQYPKKLLKTTEELKEMADKQAFSLYAWARGEVKDGANYNMLYLKEGILYSYGKHFPLAVVKGRIVMLNTERYSRDTTQHQKAVKEIAEELGYSVTEIENTERFKSLALSSGDCVIVNSKGITDKEKNPTLCLSPLRYVGKCYECEVYKGYEKRGRIDKIKCKPLLNEGQLKKLEKIKQIKKVKQMWIKDLENKEREVRESL